MRVLVTGGAGLIGSHLVDELLRARYEVTLLDNLEPEVHPSGAPDWIPRAAHFVEGDIRDPCALDTALEGCTGVFHLAAYGGFSPEFSKIADVNCTGTARLFEAIRRSGGVTRIVTASSMAIYGEGWYRCDAHGPFHGQTRDATRLERGEWSMVCPRCGGPAEAHPIPESSDVQPAGAYACSKQFSERLTLAEGRELGIGATALRYFLTYGPRQSVHNPYSGICSIFSTRLLNGLPPVVYEDGLQTRDMIHVEDVARATRVVFERPETQGRVLNVAHGEGIGIAELARRLATALERPIAPDCPGRYRALDNRHMLGDATALRELGWEPRVDLEEGLARYVDWVVGLGRVGESFGRAEERLRASGIVRSVRRSPD